MKIPKLDVTYTRMLCFACGKDNPVGLKLKPVHNGEKVIAEFKPSQFHQGWDNVIHGGILYTLLDEVAAYAMLCHGIELGVTGKSTIRFKHVAPIDEPIYASAWVTKVAKRLVEAKGMLSLRDNTVVAEADFLFYVWNWSKKAILWDMDGVIVDSSAFHFAAWQETFAKRGIEFSQEDFTKFFGTRNDFIIRTMTGNQISQEQIDAIVQEKEQSFREKAKGKLKPFPGVLKLLTNLKKGNFKLGLVSSAPKENIDFVFSELKLEGLFDAIVFGPEVAESKPSPQIYQLAAQKLDVNPKDCIVIEDSPAGIKAAKAAGMRCLAVANTHPREELREADKIIDSLENVDLVTLLVRV